MRRATAAAENYSATWAATCHCVSTCVHVLCSSLQLLKPLLAAAARPVWRRKVGTGQALYLHFHLAYRHYKSRLHVCSTVALRSLLSTRSKPCIPNLSAPRRTAVLFRGDLTIVLHKSFRCDCFGSCFTVHAANLIKHCRTAAKQRFGSCQRSMSEIWDTDVNGAVPTDDDAGAS